MDDLTPEHYAVMSANLHTATEINHRLAEQIEAIKVQRDAAEDRFVKERQAVSDLEDQLIDAENARSVLWGKYLELRRAVAARLRLEMLMGVLVITTTVALTLWLN